MTVSIRGGAFSLSADVQALPDLAAALRRLAGSLSDAVATVRRVLTDADLTLSAPLDPVGAARIAEHGAFALSESVAAAIVTERLADALLAAATAYRAIDRIDAVTRPVVLAGIRSGPAVARLVVGAGTHGDPLSVVRGSDLQAALAQDPGLADVTIDVLALAAARPGRSDDPLGVTGVAGVLAGAYPAGAPAVRAAPAGTPTDDAAGPPRSVADLLRALAVRAAPGRSGGQIDLRVLTRRGPDGSVRESVIVDLPGTTDWNLLPGSASDSVTDFGGDVGTLAGVRTAYGDGVLAALRATGVGPAVPIMFVGHSAGGMVAAELAARTAASKEFHVTHVVTAGAPIAHVAMPASVSVLSLENAGDVVPHSDGADNPTAPNWITATVRHGPPTVEGQHSLAAYGQGARDVDDSDDESVKDWLSGADEFLGADSVETTALDIARR